MKPALSPAHESYKKLNQEDKDLMKRFGIDLEDLITDAYFKSMLIMMKKIEKLEKNANLPD